MWIISTRLLGFINSRDDNDKNPTILLLVGGSEGSQRQIQQASKKLSRNHKAEGIVAIGV